jgi:adenine-specific DNA methylase
VTQRRLIEEELPLKAVNAESAREKSLRHGHISTMHLWWARRPLAMSRAVVFGTLLPDPGDDDRREEILDLLAQASSFEASTNPARINPLRKLLAEAYPDGPPKVLDCFAGGGAIPLEALRLGCDTTAVDLNPVAHLIEKCVLEYPQRFGELDGLGNNTLADDFVRWAGWVRDLVEPKLAAVFPPGGDGTRPGMYLWARTMRCLNPACRIEIPLAKSFWLAKNERRKAWVALDVIDRQVHLEVRTGPPPDGIDPDRGTVKASSVTCPVCAASTEAKVVREYGKREGFGRRLMAVLEVAGRNRRYRDPTENEIEGAETLASQLLSSLPDAEDGTSAVPDEPCDEIGYRNLQNLLFGFDTWRSLFNDRQLYVLGVLCQAVREAHGAMLEAGLDAERARAVATYLGLCVDRIADYDSSFCLWNQQREVIAHTFNFQAVPMVWDYAEIDPMMDVSGKLERCSAMDQAGDRALQPSR